MKVAVIGSGIVGLTLTRELVRNMDNIEVDLFDKSGFPSKGPSLNNSGVLHAGLYYPPKTLKSKLCIEGAKLLKSYVKKRNLPYLNCGKILVPQNTLDNKNLINIHNNAINNNVDTHLIDYKQASKIQKEIIKKEFYLYSPNTSVFSSNKIIRELILELEELNISFIKKKIIKVDGCKGHVFTKCKSKYKYDFIFNVSGPNALNLYETDINKTSDLFLLPFVGQYAEISKQLEIKTNIYPVPNPDLPFLGIHLTPRLNKKAIVGPNALPYLFSEIENKELEDIKFIFARIGINFILLINNQNSYREHALNEISFNIRNKFLKSSNQFLESQYLIKKEYISMNFSLSALRPQLISRKNFKFVNDFLYYKRHKAIHLINAVSPAFTSSFALAKYLIKFIL